MKKFTLIKASYIALNKEIQSIFSQMLDEPRCLKLVEESNHIQPLLEKSEFGDHLVLTNVVNLVNKALEVSYYLYDELEKEHNKLDELYSDFMDKIEGIYSFSILQESIDPFTELLSAYLHVHHTKALLALALIKEQKANI